MPPQPIESRVESLERRVTTLEQLPASIDDLTSQIVQLRAEMRDEFSAVHSRIAEQGKTLRGEIGDLATHMRVLHEEVISRIAQLQEAWAPPRKRSPKKA